ncbi:MAG: tetratricopeptide repeat protein [Ignavibacteriales bacterium]|nr:tetratricopeptide repeat protein [Ignavibacteriales bacterium]
MKPKYVCAHCGTELRWNDKFCGSCGQQVEWPGAAKPEPREHRNERKKPSPVSSSWKLVAGFFVVLLVGILVVELMRKPVSSPSASQGMPPQAQNQPQAAPQGPNMAAIGELNDLESQVKANPANMRLTLQLANLLHDNRFWEKATIYYKTYLAKNPKDVNARVDLGICYKELGNTGEARNQMQQALKFEPKHLFAHFNLGIVALTEGNLQESNAWFKKTVEIDPNSETGQRAKQLISQHSGTSFPQLQ